MEQGFEIRMKAFVAVDATDLSAVTEFSNEVEALKLAFPGAEVTTKYIRRRAKEAPALATNDEGAEVLGVAHE